MDCSTTGFPVLHYHLEFPRIHVHWVRDAIPVSFCHQSFPASESFPMSQLFALGGQITGASASVLPGNIQSWFPLGLSNLISLQSKGLSRVFSNITVQKASILQHSAFFMLQLSHPYMTTGKTTALTIQTCVGKVMSLLFNTLSRFIIALLPRSKCLLVSWLQSPSAVTLEPGKIKPDTASTFPLLFAMKWWGQIHDPEEGIHLFQWQTA